MSKEDLCLVAAVSTQMGSNTIGKFNMRDSYDSSSHVETKFFSNPMTVQHKPIH